MHVRFPDKETLEWCYQSLEDPLSEIEYTDEDIEFLFEFLDRYNIEVERLVSEFTLALEFDDYDQEQAELFKQLFARLGADKYAHFTIHETGESVLEFKQGGITHTLNDDAAIKNAIEKYGMNVDTL